VREGFGFGAGRGMVAAWDPDGGPLKARGSPPSQGSLFRSHVFAVLFPAHRCRCSPFPCSSAHGRGWEELGSARGDSELADRYHRPPTLTRPPARARGRPEDTLVFWRRFCSVFSLAFICSVQVIMMAFCLGNTLLSTSRSPEEGTSPWYNSSLESSHQRIFETASRAF
jgi:hypothetical protein